MLNPARVRGAARVAARCAAAARAGGWDWLLAETTADDPGTGLARDAVRAGARLIVAVAEVQGPGPALELAGQLGLDGYHLYHATRADLLRRLGRRDDAADAYDAAIARAANGAERSFLARQRDSL